MKSESTFFTVPFFPEIVYEGDEWYRVLGVFPLLLVIKLGDLAVVQVDGCRSNVLVNIFYLENHALWCVPIVTQPFK